MSANTVLPLRAVVPALFAIVLLGGCSSGSDSTAATSPGAGNGPGNAPPVASGLLAAIDGTTLQVQNESTQTTVTYGPSTTFTDSVPGTAADVKVGMCVTARPATTSGTPAAGGTADAVTAVSVQLVAPVNGACTGGAFGGPDGARPSGTPRARPSGTPRPDGSGRPGGGRGFGATGKVVSVSGSSFVVERTVPPGNTGATLTPGSTTVTTTSTTTYAKTVAAKATALATGKCVTAVGKSDDTGAIAATSISIRAAENGTCTSGFGRRPGADGGTNG